MNPDSKTPSPATIIGRRLFIAILYGWLSILCLSGGLPHLQAGESQKASTATSRAAPAPHRVSPLSSRQEQTVLDQLRSVYDKKLSPKTLQALEHFQRGVKAFVEGRYAQARTELGRPVVAQETKLGDYALFYLAASQEENTAAAKKLLEKLVSQYPDSTLSVPAKVDLAALEKEAGRWSEAARILNEPAVLEANTFAMALLAECYERTGNVSAATALYEKIYYEFPASKEAVRAAAQLAARAQFDQGQPGASRGLQRVAALIKAWQYKDALTVLQKLALKNPSAMDEIYLKQGICYYHMKKYPQAIENFKRVTAKKPESHAEALYYEYQSRRKLAEAEEAETILQTLQERYPLHALTEAALFNQAAAYEVKKSPEQAVKIYRELVTRFPEGAYCERALWKTVWLDYSESRTEKAVGGFLDYLRRFPDGPNNLAALYWAGRAYEKLKNPDAATWLYRELRARTSNWYGLLADDRLRKLERKTLAEATPAAPEISQTIERVRLREPNIAVELAQLSNHLEKIRQLRACKLDNLALKELEVIGGRPPARTDFLKAEMSDDRIDHLRWIRAWAKIIPNYYQYHHDELPIEIWKTLFPLQNWAKIKDEASKYNVDPFLVCALIRQESVYDPKALSSAKAVGLTQIMPSTGRQLARKLGYKKFTTSRLYDPSVNIAFGVYFFSSLLKRYGGNVESALAAYNGGPSRMDAWSLQFGTDDIGKLVESIPLTETRNYVKSIVAMRERYKKIYGM